MDAALLIVGLLTLVFAGATFFQGKANQRRALEARNVVWERELINDEWNFKHSGTTPISEVKIVLTVDGVSEVTAVDELKPGVLLPVPSKEHARLTLEAMEEQEKYERAQHRWSNPPPSSNPLVPNLAAMGSPPLPPFGNKSDLSAFITWRYPSGVPDTHEVSWGWAY